MNARGNGAAAVAMGVAAALALPAAAQYATVTGSNVLRVDRAEARGDASYASERPGPLRANDQLNLTLSWKPVPYDFWVLDFSGSANDNPRRGERGVSIGSFSLQRESGAGPLPYRVVAGDFDAMVTTRTSSRSLKGVYAEVQPAGPPGAQHSIVGFAGKSEDPWRDAGRGADESLALSWLAKGAGDSRWTTGAHWVRGVLAADGSVEAPRRVQDVASVTVGGKHDAHGIGWRWEGELASLRGHAPDASGPDAARVSGSAVFARLEGAHRPWGLEGRLQAERLGADYRPFGASGAADRRQAEALLAWKGAGARRAAIEWRDFREQASTPRPIDGERVQLSFSTPVPAPATTFGAVALHTASRRAGEAERVFRSLAPQLDTVVAGTSVKVRGTLLEETLGEATQRRRREWSVRAPRNAAAWGWDVYVAPTVAWHREWRPAGTERRLGLGMDATFTRGAHFVSMNLGGHSEHPGVAGKVDAEWVKSSLLYRHTRGRHTFEAEARTFERRPESGGGTRGYGAALKWTVSLDSVPTRAATLGLFAKPERSMADAVPRDLDLLRAIPLRAEREAVIARLQRELGLAGAPLSSGRLFDVPLVAGLPPAQKLAVIWDAAGISRVALLVPLDPADSPGESSRTYDRAMREMLERLGRPDRTRQVGAFGPDAAADVRSGRLVRLAEWHLPEGVVRLGIPPSVDGDVRVEIHYAGQLPPASQVGWGLEPIR